jgi:hypothetical protein
MKDAEIGSALADYDRTIATTPGKEAAWTALQTLARALVGAKLFTVMVVDMAKEQSARAYSSDAKAYPVSGTKPIRYDAWFDVIHKQRKPFVANTIAEIAKVFPDHELIWSLGCGSVVNLPIEIGGALVGTVNLLDAEHRYDEERLSRLEHLRMPSKLSYLLAR